MRRLLIKKIVENYKYNILVGFSLLISVSNFILIYSNYGNDENADVYFILTNGINILFLIVESFISNYSYEFRFLRKTEMRRRAYTTMLLFCVCFGSILSAIYFISYDSIVGFIFSGESNDLIKDSFFLFLHSSSLYLVLQINIYSLNASDRIGYGYVMSFVPQLLSMIVLTLIYLGVLERNISFLMNMIFYGYVVAAITSTLFCLKYIGFSNELDLTFSRRVILKSIKTRSAANIHNIFLNYFIVSIVSSTQTGMASTFYYAKRIAEMVHMVIFGPLSKKNINIMSDSWLNKDYTRFNEIKKSVIFKLPIIYALFLTSIVLSLWLIIFKFELARLNFNLMTIIVSMFFLSNVIIAIESVYSMVSMLTANFKIIVLANILFIATVTILQSVLLLDSLYSLGIGLVTGQLVVLIVHFVLNRHRIAEHYGVIKC